MMSKPLLAEHGLQISELSTHLEGQLVAVHPAYDQPFSGFAPNEVACDPASPAGMGCWYCQESCIASARRAEMQRFLVPWPGHTFTHGHHITQHFL